jgi:hypothetical protein
MFGFTMCEPCGALRLKGNFCPVCSGVFRDDDFDTPMLHCDGCERWIHARCEKIDQATYDAASGLSELQYFCPDCRPPGEPSALVTRAVQSVLDARLREVLRAFEPSVSWGTAPLASLVARVELSEFRTPNEFQAGCAAVCCPCPVAHFRCLPRKLNATHTTRLPCTQCCSQKRHLFALWSASSLCSARSPTADGLGLLLRLPPCARKLQHPFPWPPEMDCASQLAMLLTRARVFCAMLMVPRSWLAAVCCP